jgi:hypothetical protein
LSSGVIKRGNNKRTMAMARLSYIGPSIGTTTCEWSAFIGPITVVNTCAFDTDGATTAFGTTFVVRDVIGRE